MLGTLVLCAALLPAAAVRAEVAPDATGVGPLATTSAEYKFDASVDPDVIDDRATELWAVVYRPTNMTSGRFPLVVVLHGNHGTCGTGTRPRRDDRRDYTDTGTCPPGYVVTPNHAGYAYFANRLASWGYVVVSINANRGITAGSSYPGDLGLNLARGRLILKHLQRLSEWNTSGGTPPELGVDLRGKLDFNGIGLVGHSRGGEGIRAAYEQYRDAGSPWPARIPDPVRFKALFEIGPVDGQTSRVLNADGTIWNVLLPVCDGDVSNLQGIKPYDRMLQIRGETPATQKSSYMVWGANHNFYNTEWQVSDSGGCTDHTPIFSPSDIESVPMQQTGQASIMALIRGNVGPSAMPTFNANFNPQYDLPPVVATVTRVDQGYTDSPNATITRILEDFDQPTGTSSSGFPTDTSGITISHDWVPEHDFSQRGGLITWDLAGPDTYFQTNLADTGAGVDITGNKTLDLRVSRQDSPLNPPTPGTTSFSIRLVNADGTMSAAVPLFNYTDLTGPPGGPFGNKHQILYSVRIPLTEFTGAVLTQAHGVRLTFDDTDSGAINVANIRLSNKTGSPPAVTRSRAARQAGGGAGANQAAPNNEGNAITAIRRVASAAALGGQAGVEIEVSSTRAFPVRDELVVLRVGSREFSLGRYAGSTLDRLVFTLTPEEFGQLANGDNVAVAYGRGGAAGWSFGQLDKSKLG